MILNIIGECDKRPVIYCAMKLLQEIGDVLLLTPDDRLLRLSNTYETGGHYQNTMIGVANGGVDDFFDDEDFPYNQHDFDHMIVENIITVDADLYLYVEGAVTSEMMEDNLDMLESYETISLYKGNLIENNTYRRLEQFEAYGNMCPMTPKIVKAVSQALSTKLGISADKLEKVGLKAVAAAPRKSAVPEQKKGEKAKSGLFGKRK